MEAMCLQNVKTGSKLHSCAAPRRMEEPETTAEGGGEGVRAGGKLGVEGRRTHERARGCARARGRASWRWKVATSLEVDVSAATRQLSELLRLTANQCCALIGGEAQRVAPTSDVVRAHLWTPEVCSHDVREGAIQ